MGNEQSGGAPGGAGAPSTGAPTSPAASSAPQQATPNSALPKGVKRMAPELQKKFASANAAQNMRILIRGARGVGKSSLFSRLEGGPFSDEHVPTPEVQVTHIAWNYKMSDEVVKVEVWDVVDQGFDDPSASSGLPSHPAGALLSRRASVDAASMDIYRGAHAVILVCDPCRRETLQYCEQLLPTIPPQMAVLLLVQKHVN